jgi:hypothetical protein
MINLRKAAYVLAALLFLTISAKADTMNYTLTGPGVSATFSATQNPAFSGSPNGEIVVPVTGASFNGQTVTTVDFFSSIFDGGLGAILGGQQYQLDGAQLFSYKNGVVTLDSGTFTLDYFYTLTAVDPPSPTPAMPEPASAAMLIMGIAGLVMFRQRVQAN